MGAHFTTMGLCIDPNDLRKQENMNPIKIFVLTLCLSFIVIVRAQEIKVPAVIPTEHPRLLTHGDEGRSDLQQKLSTDPNAKRAYDEIVATLHYVANVQNDSTWLLSRLQMYWKSHYTDVYVKNGIYQSGSGKAPVPTVRFTGTRDAVTNYATPKLEDIKPYMDEDGKIYLQNRSVAGQPWEWIDQSKSGRTIESINQRIIELVRDAAFLYWYTGDERYGKMAYDVFDTYMTGMSYRNEPIDLNHGHDQTLVGLQAFEVIHEDIVMPLTIGYDFLYGYIQKHAPSKLPVYKETFSKWADIIIKNGVSFNNWDLIEARFIAHIALILDNDNAYPDHKGCQYYLDRILNINATRQWSLKDLIAYGFDANTGIWNECPGYSQGVVGDFTGFINLFDNTLHSDIQPAMPRVTKAVEALPQYLFPNGYIIGFGDTHYSRLNTSSVENMIRNAQSFGKKDQEIFFTKELKMLRGFDRQVNTTSGGRGLQSLFDKSALKLNDTIKAAQPKDFITPLFYAPNASWLVQRSGYNTKHALMISQAGSLGNHMHANGIAMELYGKGVVMAPEGGIGTTYMSGDYAEYYSQFPAHNTVCVDGISSYPVMKSNHAFEVKGNYPLSNQKAGYFPGLTYSDLYFLEPETNSDQQRLMGIIRTSDSTGYYVDIFRSKQKSGGERYHDYIFHSIGQDVVITDTKNQRLALTKTDKPTFADVNIMGFDYWYNNKSVITTADFKATFRLGVPNKDSLMMNMWMKGDQNREVFSVMAPKSTAYGRDDMLPRDIEELPLPTIMVRQKGEAWSHPFAAVFEPSTSSQPTSIKSISSFRPRNVAEDFVGLEVQNKSGISQYIFSSTNTYPVVYNDITVSASYAVVSMQDNQLNYLFIGRGTNIRSNDYSITSINPVTAALQTGKDALWFTADEPTILSVPEGVVKTTAVSFIKDAKTIKVFAVHKVVNNQKVLQFSLPVMSYTKLTMISK